MSIQDDVEADPRTAVFDVLERVRTGMLGLSGVGEGLKPMSHYPDPDAGVVWFISSSHTDLVQALDMGEDADYVIISEDHDVHVSMRGKLFHVDDKAKLDELWNPVIAAWFEGGRDDPQIALLRLELEVAEIWASSVSTLKFGFEIVRSNLDKSHQPDVGIKATVDFAKAA